MHEVGKFGYITFKSKSQRKRDGNTPCAGCRSQGSRKSVTHSAIALWRYPLSCRGTRYPRKKCPERSSCPPVPRHALPQKTHPRQAHGFTGRGLTLWLVAVPGQPPAAFDKLRLRLKGSGLVIRVLHARSFLQLSALHGHGLPRLP